MIPHGIIVVLYRVIPQRQRVEDMAEPSADKVVYAAHLLHFVFYGTVKLGII